MKNHDSEETDGPHGMPDPDLELLTGVESIAGAIDKTPRQTYYMVERGLLPAFKLGGKWHARRGTLRAHFAKLEAEAIA